jgi:hypothetical protein
VSTLRLFLVFATFVLSALPAAALADDPEPLPAGSYAVPYDGYRHPVSSWPNATNFEMFDFTIYADYAGGEFDVDVATSPDTDADGRLTDVVASYVAPLDPRAAAGEVFTARTTVDSQWLGTLGTYYWRGYYTAWGTLYTTPIQRIDIVERPPSDPPGPPAPPPVSPPAQTAPAPLPAAPPAPAARADLTRTSAKTIIRRTIRRQTGRSAQGLTATCSLPSAGRANCAVAWRDARYRYRGNAELRSTAAGVTLSLDGTRTRRACDGGRCRRALHWSLATA